MTTPKGPGPSVPRYDFILSGMYRRPDGRFVAVEDHDAIVAKKDAVIARIEKILWSFYNDDAIIPAWNDARDYFTEHNERIARGEG